MAQVLALGGNLQSNCLIVGAMLGAIVGFDHLNNEQVHLILNCDIS